MSTAKTPSVHQLKITLRGIRPPVWRRLVVPSSMTLAGLHGTIQVAFGWFGYHLHEFSIGTDRFGDGAVDPDGWGPRPKDESRAKLARVAPPGTRFLYEYDFGDSWEHDVVVEKTTAAEPGVAYPVCVSGRRACPPEDCGGVWGYAHLREVLADRAHPEHDEMVEWVGGSFDPDAFDIDDLNAMLGGLARVLC